MNAKHINWEKRRDDHTRNAIDFANAIDFPTILLVIYYPDMAAHQQPPCHYSIDVDGVKPITRKQALRIRGIKVMYLPDGSAEVVWQ